MTAKPKKETKETKAKAELNEKAQKPKYSGYLIDPDRKRIKLYDPEKKEVVQRFLITSAQNNTPVNEGFFNSLLACAEETGAQLLVSRFTYNTGAYENGERKATAKETGRDARQNLTKQDADNLWYDPKIRPYIMDKSAELAKGLVFGGELNILPTAISPLSGFQNYFKDSTGIVPHVQHSMESLPGMKEDGARFLYTTGTCTKRNYIQKKAGQKAEAHHTYGALMVEVDTDGNWFVRQIAADDKGAFYDLSNKYLPSGKVLHNQRVEAITWGDIHIEKMADDIMKACIGAGGMLDSLNPREQHVHDLSDFTARGHHEIKKEFSRAAKFHEKKESVEKGFSLAASFLKAAERPQIKTKVINSNHHDHFITWLEDNKNIENDPINANFFYRAKAKIHEELGKGNTGFVTEAYEWAIREKEKLKNTDFIPTDHSYRICKDVGGDSAGIECGIHGHIGNGGSRGSPTQYTKLGRKANTAHTHSAGIKQGVFTAGVMGELDMGYNKGPSSWSHSHIITYPNGKRTIVTMKGDNWHATGPEATPKKAANSNTKGAFKKAAGKKPAAKKPAPVKKMGGGKNGLQQAA